jgi:hypothetical protein
MTSLQFSNHSHRIPSSDDSASFSTAMMEGFHRDTAFSSSAKSSLHLLHDDSSFYGELPDVTLDDMQGIDDDLSDDDCPAPDSLHVVKRHLMLLGADDLETGTTSSVSSTSSSYVRNRNGHSPYRSSRHNPTISTAKNTIITKDGKEINIHKALTWRQKQQIPVPKLNPKRNPARPVCLFVNYLGTRLPPVMEPSPIPMASASLDCTEEPSCKPTDPPMVSPDQRKRMMGSSPTDVDKFTVTHLPQDGPKSKKRRGKFVENAMVWFHFWQSFLNYMNFLLASLLG